MDLNKVIIETERLRLVPLSEKHAEPCFLEYREPVTMYMNYGPAESLDRVKERILQTQNEMKKGLELSMVVLVKESGEFVERFGLENLDQENPEMGGWLKESAHGNRYGQEAAAALKKWADKNLQYDHLVWSCAAANAPSRKLAESLGGKVQREYVKTNARGMVWSFVDYWIPKQ